MLLFNELFVEDEIVVSTTRPETILGDVAVAVNPKDDRYSSFIGRKLWHPFRKEAIPIIADDFVDSTFGSGNNNLCFSFYIQFNSL